MPTARPTDPLLILRARRLDVALAARDMRASELAAQLARDPASVSRLRTSGAETRAVTWVACAEALDLPSGALDPGAPPALLLTPEPQGDMEARRWRVRITLAAHGLTVAALAREMGVDRALVQRLVTRGWEMAGAQWSAVAAALSLPAEALEPGGPVEPLTSAIDAA